jgi:TolB-like protein
LLAPTSSGVHLARMVDADPITRLNAALEGRYRIERQLGEGGMATVYLADDLRHERKVALKVLKPELAAVVGAERFVAEIKTTANLQHPHILPLFDSSEADGFLFYVMPYVAGESLRERLDREHQLPVEEAVSIATKVAGALQAAHEQGVIHRDIKPANILLSKGEPLVSDFGIALAVGSAGGERLTETGLSVGTPHYMSPEQATGDLSVGAASDVYALGCVLYEMLVGEPPYTGSTAQAILGKIIAGDAERASGERRSVPPHVDAAILKALEKLPADRFLSASAFSDALNDPSFRHGAGATIGAEGARRQVRLAVAAGVAALALGLAWTLSRDEGDDPVAPIEASVAVPGDPDPVQPSVAVLPCVNMSGNPDNEYFSDGITAELINALGQIRDLRVPARISSFAFKGQNVPIRQMADALDVVHVVDCSVRRDARRVLITAQLVDARTDTQLWSDSFERELTDIFAIQREIATTIADRLQITLTGEARSRLVIDATESPQAYEAYLRGRYLLEIRSPETRLEGAIEQFQRATELDPGYAEAYAGLADAYVLQAAFGWLEDFDDFRVRTQLGLTASNRATDLDPELGIAFPSRGFGLWNLGEWEAAEAAFQEGIRLNPQYALTRQWYGLLLFTTGRVEEGVRQAELAVELNPLYPQAYRNLAWGLTAAGRTDEAIEVTEELIALDPTFSLGWDYHGQLLLWHGDPEGALAAQLEAASLGGYDVDGYEEVLRAAVRFVRTGEPQTIPVPAGLTRQVTEGLYVNTGQFDEALEMFETDLEAGSIGVTAYQRVTWWAATPLVDDPRYRALLEEAGIVF